MDAWGADRAIARFSALQRAEIAEICVRHRRSNQVVVRFSALQRAEIAEIWYVYGYKDSERGFSALQRAEIAEIIVW